MNDTPLKIGFLLNPIAGIGGPVALKGSDGVVAEAKRRGGESKVATRVSACLAGLVRSKDRIQWITMPGEMGADVLADFGMNFSVVGAITQGKTTAEDTRKGVGLIETHSVDLLLFGGGDGTARDIFDAAPSSSAILGIPCGVKMHSGVFGTSPGAVAEIIRKIVQGDLLSVLPGEIRDIDERALRDGAVKSRFYGELPVPDDVRYVQQTKSGGREVESLVVQEIAAEIEENLEPDTLYLMGPGTTVAGVMDVMGLASTLLGIDVVLNGDLIEEDATETELWSLVNQHKLTKILVTVIGGQGYIFGRGNQQLSPRIIRKVGIGNIVIIASKSKLGELNGRPLLVDSGDAELDTELAGMTPVITGYEDKVLYRIGLTD